MNRSELQSVLRSRLGAAYTAEVGARVANVRQALLTDHLELFQQAQKGQIDGEAMAVEINRRASKAIAELKAILGDRFEDVFGDDLGEDFILADPAIAKEIDYTAVDPEALITTDDITKALEPAVRLEALLAISEGTLPLGELASKLKLSVDELRQHVDALRRFQLVSGDPASLSWRVTRVASHDGTPTLVITDDADQPRVFWLSRFEGPDSREFARKLSGLWEYRCEATSEMKFADEELGRGGVMRINAVSHSVGVDAKIVAKRLWYKTADGVQHAADPVEWKSDGGLSFKDGRMSFRYTIDAEMGMTEDEYEITDARFVWLKGSFVHRRVDGKRVEGRVEIRKMLHADDLQWLPTQPA